MSYALGPVKPFVADVANTIGPKMAPAAIYGWRATAFDMQGHPAGLALDWAVGDDKVKGQAIADYFQANAGGLQVRYVIWAQRIWYPGKAWTPMATRTGAADVNHLRHVHVSYNVAVSDGRRLNAGAAPAAPAAAAATGPAIANVSNPLQALSAGLGLLDNLAKPEMWVRIGQVLGGVVAILGGVILLNRDLAGPILNTAAAVVPQARAAKVLLGAVGATTKVGKHAAGTK